MMCRSHSASNKWKAVSECHEFAVSSALANPLFISRRRNSVIQVYVSYGMLSEVFRKEVRRSPNAVGLPGGGFSSCQHVQGQ